MRGGLESLDKCALRERLAALVEEIPACPGKVLLDRRDAMEQLRDAAADRYVQQLFAPWRPFVGSMVNHRSLTAAVIDSRDYLDAKRRSETEVLIPADPRIAFTGGPDCNDHDAIWKALDKVHAKHPDMVLLHGGTPTGAERIAVCWAANGKVTHIAFRPNWERHAKAVATSRASADHSPSSRRREHR